METTNNKGVKQPRWYALVAISGREGQVKEYIELDMKNRGYSQYVPQVLIPTKTVLAPASKKEPNKRVTKEVNLLPGYVLVEAVLEGEIKHLLRNTPNVLGFLGGTAHPSPLRQADVNRMLGADEESKTTSTAQLSFREGESVKIAAGPFFGFNGTVEVVNAEKQKLTVSVKIFGRVTPLELGFDQVEKE